MSESPREAILQVLQNRAQRLVSGEELASHLGISRAAVWKHIQALRNEGYQIEAVHRQGYRLLAAPDLPTAAAVEPLLTTKTCGRPYYFFPQLESTNLEARRRAGAGAAEGTTIAADEQTMGRGRRGRNWVSKPNSGLWMSVILRPTIPTAQAGMLMLMSAVAVREAIIAVTGLPATIKWPNDILIHRRKAAGILVELAADQEFLRWAVVGIGINVRSPAGGFTPDVARVAITLEEAAGRPVSRPQLAAQLCLSLENWYQQVQNRRTRTLLDAWRAGCDWLGTAVQVYQGDQTFLAVAHDINEDGSLIVVDDQGQRRLIHAGEVSLRPASGQSHLQHPE